VCEDVFLARLFVLLSLLVVEEMIVKLKILYEELIQANLEIFEDLVREADYQALNTLREIRGTHGWNNVQYATKLLELNISTEKTAQATGLPHKTVELLAESSRYYE